MLRIAAFLVVFTLYIIPGNILLYNLSRATVDYLVYSQDGIALSLRGIPFIYSLINNSGGLAPSILYVIYVLIFFAAAWFALKYILFKMIYIYEDGILSEENMLVKYNTGQKSINRLSRLIITLALLAHLLTRVYDVRILMLYLFSVLFIFSSYKKKKAHHTDDQGEKTAEASIEDPAEGEIKSFDWYYQTDPLDIEKPVRFTAKIRIDMNTFDKYASMEHQENSPYALRKYVIDGLCTEVTELAGQIKNECQRRGYTTYNQVSAVMSLQQSFKYVPDIDSKGMEEYIRYPLQTLVDGEGDCDCHGVCSAAILYSMGFDVVILRIIYPQKNEPGHLAIAVGGADGIPGNFFNYNNRKYYYCEVTPQDNSEATNNRSMKFKVGEMPDMPGANITIVPIRETISN